MTQSTYFKYKALILVAFSWVFLIFLWCGCAKTARVLEQINLEDMASDDTIDTGDHDSNDSDQQASDETTIIDESSLFDENSNPEDSITNDELKNTEDTPWETESSCVQVVPTMNGVIVTVDSTYEDAYTSNAIDDGFIDGGQTESYPQDKFTTTWASGDGLMGHWIEVEFPNEVQLHNLTIWWAINDYQSLHMTAQTITVEWWVPISNQYTIHGQLLSGGETLASSTYTFEPPINTTKLKLTEPAGQGPPTYSNIFWITELEYTIQTCQ